MVNDDAARAVLRAVEPGLASTRALVRAIEPIRDQAAARSATIRSVLQQAERAATVLRQRGPRKASARRARYAQIRQALLKLDLSPQAVHRLLEPLRSALYASTECPDRRAARPRPPDLGPVMAHAPPRILRAVSAA
jgi:hypothetical protein